MFGEDVDEDFDQEDPKPKRYTASVGGAVTVGGTVLRAHWAALKGGTVLGTGALLQFSEL